ncbi:MAG TPA: hypothetical protein VFB89_11635, partial [Gemmatimonadales bacterium]|nr:hypothetical protein [Gemmatimonadales bacterium]
MGLGSAALNTGACLPGYCTRLLYAIGLSWAGFAVPAPAQSLPQYAPINPVALSRSGVYFQPYRNPRLGHLGFDVRLDYGSAIEYNIPSPRPSYLLDGEFLRLDVTATRDLNERIFLFGTVGVGGGYAGF